MKSSLFTKVVNVINSSVVLTDDEKEICIDVLERDLPIKSLNKEVDIDGRVITPCGYCDEPISAINEFCPSCGHRIDWSK